MAITQVDAARLANDILQPGVIITDQKESAALRYLPFVDFVGTSLRMARENVNPAVDNYAPGDTWTEATPTFTNATAIVAILGGLSQVDNFMDSSYADVNDLSDQIGILRVKAARYKYADLFINGDTATNAKGFDGLAKLITVASGQHISMGTNGAALTLAKLDEMIDKVRGRGPDSLLMSRRTRRAIRALDRSALVPVLVDDTEVVELYNGIPVVIDDFITDTEVAGSSSNASSIYAVRWGGDGLFGIQTGEPVWEPAGYSLDKDATLYRVKWQAGVILRNQFSAARLSGIIPSA